MLALVLKAIHVFASMLFLGLGIGSVFYKLRAYRSGDPAALAFCDREIVLADWLFTVPSGVLLPATGLWMAHLYRLPLTTPWILVGVGGWALAGLTWLPAAFLQIRMRGMSARALERGEPLPPAYRSAHRAWMTLGLPSFTAAMFVLWAMIAKAAAF
ncbi:MAG: DUF2269 domain-containing protein [Sandaracinaceae bacterium]|nr:DUF2269 domain-containing protein [Sandaracinaceae bacterium]